MTPIKQKVPPGDRPAAEWNDAANLSQVTVFGTKMCWAQSFCEKKKYSECFSKNK